MLRKNLRHFTSATLKGFCAPKTTSLLPEGFYTPETHHPLLPEGFCIPEEPWVGQV